LLACWAAGRKAGLFLAVASTVISTAADLKSAHPNIHLAIVYWNAGCCWRFLECGGFLQRSWMRIGPLVEAQPCCEPRMSAWRRLSSSGRQHCEPRSPSVNARRRRSFTPSAARKTDQTRFSWHAGGRHRPRNPQPAHFRQGRLYTLDKHLKRVLAEKTRRLSHRNRPLEE